MKQWCIFETEVWCPRCHRVERELLGRRNLFSTTVRLCAAEQIAYETLYPGKIRRGERWA